MGINDAGQVVGYYGDATGYHGFVDTGGTFTTFNDPLGVPGATFAQGINDSGQIVGVYSDSAGLNHGFLFASGAFTTVDDPSATTPFVGTNPRGINNAGEIAGYYSDGAGDHGFLATPTASSPEPSTLTMMFAAFLCVVRYLKSRSSRLRTR
jgi:probable HAF family extracellular repeat protein